MLSSIFLILLIGGLVGLTLKRPILGIMWYYGIRMCIPFTARVFTFSFNTISLLVLIICLLPSFCHFYKKCLVEEIAYIQSIKKLFVVSAILTCFAFIVPKTYQWGSLLQMFGTELVPSILLMVFLRKQKDYVLFGKVVAIMALFASWYGIYTYSTSSNPIFDYFNTSTVEAVDLEEYATGRMGLSGIAVGIYDDKIAMQLVCLLLFMFIIVKKEIGKYLRYSSSISCLLCLYLTTQRTGLLCVVLFGILLIFDPQYRGYKKYILPISVIALLVVLLYGNKQVYNAIYSILYLFNDSMQKTIGVEGSNSALRLLQLTNCFEYLNLSNVLQGAGYGFTAYYYTEIWNREWYGIDFRFYGFESFIFKVLMNSGIIGLYCWGRFFWEIWKKLNINKTRYFTIFTLIYVIAICMTDASVSLYLFFMLFVVNYKKMSLRAI